MTTNTKNGNGSPPPPVDEEGARSAARFIEKIADGQCHMDLSEALNKLGRSLAMDARTRNATVAGEVTLKLKFSTDEQGMTGVAYEINSKLPKSKTAQSVFWVTKGGNFSEQNPRQQQLPGIREVPKARAEVRDIDDDNDSADARSV